MTASFIKKNSAVFSAIAAVLLCLAVFGFVWSSEILPAESKSKALRFSDDYSVFTDDIEDSIELSFSTDQSIYAFALVFDFDEQPSGDLMVTLTDGQTGEVLSTSLGQMGNILPLQYTGLGLDTPVKGGAQRNYQLMLVPQYKGSGRLRIGCSASSVTERSLICDDVTQNGEAAFLITTAQIGNFLSKFFWAFSIAASLVVGVGIFAAFHFKVEIHRFYLGSVLVLGLLFCMILPPYSAPDEQYHINQSFSVATTLTSRLPLGSVPLMESYRRPSDEDVLLQDANTTVFTWQRVSDTMFTLSEDKAGSFELYSEMQADDSDYLYTFSSLAVALCFLLQLGFTPTLYAGRIANLIVYAALTTLAVKRVPFGKKLMACIGLLPMSLHLAASFSRDSLTLSLAFLFTALCFEAIVAKIAYSKGQWIALIATAILLVPAKIVYFPLACLILAIPAARFGKYKKNSAAIKACFLVLCAATLIFSSARYTILGLFSRADTPQALTSFAEQLDPEEATAWNLTADSENADFICYSPAYVITHPLRTFTLCANSLRQNSEHYIKTLVGGKLSYYTLDISWIWILLIYVILFLAAIPCLGELHNPRRPQAFLLALLCMMLVIAGCITWTPTYYDTIYGLQGRYFLPALPMLLLAVRPEHIISKTTNQTSVPCYMLIADIFVLLNAFLAICCR